MSAFTLEAYRVLTIGIKIPFVNAECQGLLCLLGIELIGILSNSFLLNGLNFKK